MIRWMVIGVAVCLFLITYGIVIQLVRVGMKLRVLVGG